MNDRLDNVAAALSFDPLAAAEKITGSSYKEDAETATLGMGLAMLHNQRKDALLKSAADSYLNMSFTEQMALFAALGFEEVYRESFAGDAVAETFTILWHLDGLLATCESYGTRRNTAKVHYNYRHQTGGYPAGLTSSGHMRDDVWVGDHDASEGIRHNLSAMRAEGVFLPQWAERPWLWLLNYSESKGDCDYAAINSAKIARLPERVRSAITPVQKAVV
jgi:hypothetical protein